jgi:hypothetical protein
MHLLLLLVCLAYQRGNDEGAAIVLHDHHAAVPCKHVHLHS